MSKNVTEAIEAVNGTIYQVGNSPEYICVYGLTAFTSCLCTRLIDATSLDAASGCSYDWVKEKLGMKWSFLADIQGNDFRPPRDQILSRARELWAGLLVLADRVISDGIREYEPMPPRNDTDNSANSRVEVGYLRLLHSTVVIGLIVLCLRLHSP